MRSTRNVLLLAAVVAMPGAARAQLKAAPGDWPGWRGPDRTGVSTETGLLKEWPRGGPKLLWKAKGLGIGYSTPSVAGALHWPPAALSGPNMISASCQVISTWPILPSGPDMVFRVSNPKARR